MGCSGKGFSRVKIALSLLATLCLGPLCYLRDTHVSIHPDFEMSIGGC